MTASRGMLAARRDQLLSQSAQQRETLRRQFDAAAMPLLAADRGLVRVGRLMGHPIVTVGTLLLLAVMVRRGTLRGVGTMLALAGSTARLGRLLGGGAVGGR